MEQVRKIKASNTAYAPGILKKEWQKPLGETIITTRIATAE